MNLPRPTVSRSPHLAPGRPFRQAFIALLGASLTYMLIGPSQLWSASEPCAVRSIGVDPSLATGAGTTENGQALGQIFYAPDTLIRSITVWRPASDAGGSAMRLYLLDTHSSFGNGLPEPDAQAFFEGPAIVVGSGDDEHPIRCEFYFEPPLVLPRRGIFCFALQAYRCWGRWNVLGTDVSSYSGGAAWYFGRRTGECVPSWFPQPSELPSFDLAFRIEFVNPEVPMPVSVVGAEPDTCRVRITWAATDASARVATVFRRTLGTDWLALGQVVADGTGQLVFDDPLVTPGQRYGYRLGLETCANDPLFGETWVTAAGGLDLKMVGSGPVEGRLRLNWTAVLGTAFAATVYRREVKTLSNIPVDSTWRVMGTTQSDGSGEFFFDDARVLGGTMYDYRLGVKQCGREAYLGKANWLQVPCGVGLPILTSQISTCDVRLAWSTPDSAQRSATLYRRGPDAGWTSLGLITSDIIGLSSYVDRQVLPGGQYAFRLGVKTPYCNESLSNEVSAFVPSVQVAAGVPHAAADHVSLSWSATGMTHALATVYRRSLDTEWQPLAEVAADDSGHVRYDDRQIADAGSRAYTYRLGIMQCGQEYFFGQVWIDVPYVMPLTLTGVRPNPGDTDLTVTFSLPDAAPARFEVMDLAGRRIFTQEVGGLGRGDHALNLTQGRNLPSGVYLIRLVRGGEIRTTRGVIIRQRPGRSR